MKTIQATITIEVPYSNDYMNYADNLNKKIKQIVAEADFINCHVVAGKDLPTNGMPILREKDET